MRYYVYVLQSQKDKMLYVGMTKNIKNRIERHNNGREPSTKCRIPFKLVHFEELEDRKRARVREKYWKSGAGREKIKALIKSKF